MVKHAFIHIQLLIDVIKVPVEFGFIKIILQAVLSTDFERINADVFAIEKFPIFENTCYADYLTGDIPGFGLVLFHLEENVCVLFVEGG